MYPVCVSSSRANAVLLADIFFVRANPRVSMLRSGEVLVSESFVSKVQTSRKSACKRAAASRSSRSLSSCGKRQEKAIDRNHSIYLRKASDAIDLILFFDFSGRNNGIISRTIDAAVLAQIITCVVRCLNSHRRNTRRQLRCRLGIERRYWRKILKIGFGTMRDVGCTPCNKQHDY